MTKIKQHIPNLITLSNLFCGCISLVLIFRNDIPNAIFFMILGLFLDFFDGMSARLLKVSGELGKQLDSLADAITFGAVPGAVMFVLISENTDNYYLPFLGFLITAFSAMRLAKFNIDTRQSEVFFGLPTPANAIFIGSLYLIQHENKFEFLSNIINNIYFLLSITVLSSIIMNIDLKLFSLKFKTFDFKQNIVKYLFIMFCVIIIISLKIIAIPIIIISYIAISISQNILQNENTN